MSVVELRYAEALLLAAGDTSDDAGAALNAFSALMFSHGEAKAFLLDPTCPPAAKKEAAERLLPENAPVVVKNFIHVLIDKGRLALLPGVCAAYGQLSAERRNRPDICVYSAFPLDEAELTKIRDTYRERYNIPEARVRPCVEPGLLGGVMVRIGDIRIDGTLLGRLNGLGSALAFER